jgi:hypothetical protein
MEAVKNSQPSQENTVTNQRESERARKRESETERERDIENRQTERTEQ